MIPYSHVKRNTIACQDGSVSTLPYASDVQKWALTSMEVDPSYLPEAVTALVVGYEMYELLGYLLVVFIIIMTVAKTDEPSVSN